MLILCQDGHDGHDHGGWHLIHFAHAIRRNVYAHDVCYPNHALHVIHRNEQGVMRGYVSDLPDPLRLEYDEYHEYNVI